MRRIGGSLHEWLKISEKRQRNNEIGTLEILFEKSGNGNEMGVKSACIMVRKTIMGDRYNTR